MKKSQIAVLSAAGVLVLVVAAAVIVARIMIAQIDAGDYSGRIPPAPDSGQPGVTGDLDLTGFSRIDARGHWQIMLERGADWDVSLSYPESMRDRLRVRVDGDRLVLGYRGGSGFRWFGNDESVTARIVLPELSAVDLAGAGTIDMTGFNGDQLTINASGASEIKGHDGRYEDLNIIVSGAGDVNLTDMPAVNARVVLSGAGQVTLTMDGGTLGGTVSGVGQIKYHGTVSEQNVVTSGFSSVEPLD
jgi:hypothetical protein